MPYPTDTRTLIAKRLAVKYCKCMNYPIVQQNKSLPKDKRIHKYHLIDAVDILLRRGFEHPDTQKELELNNTKK